MIGLSTGCASGESTSGVLGLWLLGIWLLEGGLK